MYNEFLDDDYQIYLRINKSGKNLPNLWLIHGFTDSSICFQDLFKSSLSNRFNIYAIDLPGFGKSHFNPKIDNLENIHEIIIKLINKYTNNGEIYLMAHSLRAAIAVLIASEKDNVRCLINIDGLLLEDNRGESSLSYANEYIDCEDFKNFMINKLNLLSKNNMYLLRYINNITNSPYAPLLAS